MTFIKEQYSSNMSLADAEKLCLQVLKNVMEERITKDNIELAVVTTEKKVLETREPDYVQGIIT